MTVETYDMLEDRIRDTLNDATMNHDPATRKEALSVLEVLLKAQNDADKNSTEYQDKEARIELEKEKAKEAAKLEREKLKIPWQRAALEIGKVTLPTVISLIAYGGYQRRVMKYEENGKVCSTAGRELHLPNPFKFGK